jgi:hypothetical protein
MASAAARLLRTYAIQVETLRRLRNGGSQFVRVEHVHVNEGGQAVVGTLAVRRNLQIRSLALCDRAISSSLRILPASSRPSVFGRQNLAHIGLGDPELSRYAGRRDSGLEGGAHRIRVVRPTIVTNPLSTLHRRFACAHLSRPCLSES